MRNALERNEFSLRFQIQVNIVKKEIHGIEVLLRWQHPTEGMIPPSTFIPIAEDSGQICTIGQWVLQQSCQFMKKLLSEGIELKHISVNVSGIQFLNEQFTDQVDQLLNETGLEGKHLELEIIAEGVEQPEQMNFLHREGCSLIQGYLFSKPVTGDELIALLKEPEVIYQKIE
jgi:EAL domain-containing protein (putative c-di-GMP-specific phosphodiesterase class I)